MATILHQGRAVHRAVREITHYWCATLGHVTISGVEYIVRLVNGDTWKVVTKR